MITVGTWHTWIVNIHSLQLMSLFSVQLECTHQVCSHHLQVHSSGSLSMTLLHLTLLQVSEKEEEKATLLTMCNELMNKLEREGISL